MDDIAHAAIAAEGYDPDDLAVGGRPGRVRAAASAGVVVVVVAGQQFLVLICG